eukprot:CAMPEP_0170324406 /NCGR_PEP_ID=MMETSP0116_2-20130129/63038_1 /TAXON_ID=400756 /ORGANISM="Durinskia baltica, Strain CSIRO CS-38" /LENGTH=47 /DNA_ID= /DNA_START= /DNA_END= /DNA_ORIENTATION=
MEDVESAFREEEERLVFLGDLEEFFDQQANALRRQVVDGTGAAAAEA